MSPRNSVNHKKALKEFHLFVDLAPEQLADLAQGTRVASFHREQAIYRPGDAVAEMFILLSGQVKLALSCNRGNERVIDVLDAGQSFGESELFGNRPYLAGAVAVKASTVLGVGREALARVMAKDARVSLRIMRSLAQRQVEMESELATRQSGCGSQRTMNFFLQLAGPNRDPVGETPLTLRLSKQLLAYRLNMQPETLSRALRDLSDAGLIAVDGCRIRLKNTVIERFIAEDAFARPVLIPSRRRLARTTGTDPMQHASRAGNALLLWNAINKAGRQRALSQRMAKSWLMLERGVLSRRSQLVLRQSMDLFEGQLRDLDGMAIDAETRSARSELAEVWRPYRSLLEAEPSRKLARELFSLNEDVLEAAQRLTLNFERADGTTWGRLINLAGRQRMLSQRAAKLYLFRHMGINAARCRGELEEAGVEFSNALAELASASGGRPEIEAELQKAAAYWDSLLSAMSSRDGRVFSAAARKVFATSESLMRRMDSAVELYVATPVQAGDIRTARRA